MEAKLLTEKVWADITNKFKVNDPGLPSALATYEKLAEDKHEERLKALAPISSLGGKFKTNLLEGIKASKTQKAKPEVIKNLTTVVD